MTSLAGQVKPATRSTGAVLALAGIVATFACTSVGAAWLDPKDQVPAPPSSLPWRALARWDAGWYAEIARSGYSFSPASQSSVAFFPLYPLAMRALSSLGLDVWIAGALLSACAGAVALVLFEIWARRLLPEQASSATVLLASYPFAFYLFGIVYSDALFLALVVGAFLALETDRPWLSAALGALATATRPVAPAVVLGLLLRSVERRRARNENLRAVDFVPALAALGLVAYMAFLEGAFDDATAFATAQAAPGWDQPPTWRTWLKVAWFEALFPRSAPLVAIRLGGHALVTLVALALVWPTKSRLGWGYAVYAAAAVGLPAVSSKDFQGLGRYVLAAFPLFLTLSGLLGGRPRLMAAYVAMSAVLWLLLAFAFGGGGYVA